jgi:hypothetical protein
MKKSGSVGRHGAKKCSIFVTHQQQDSQLKVAMGCGWGLKIPTHVCLSSMLFKA